jgi:hypothetical protein
MEIANQGVVLFLTDDRVLFVATTEREAIQECARVGITRLDLTPGSYRYLRQPWLN